MKVQRNIILACALLGMTRAVGAQHYPIYCKSNGYCHVPPLPDSCTNDADCQTAWYNSYCQSSGVCHAELPPKCKTDADCQAKSLVSENSGYTPPAVGKICIDNDAGFVLHWDMRDLLSDKQSQDSGSYPIDQSKCMSLETIPDIKDQTIVMCRVHAVAGESKDCADAVIFQANSTETATFRCSGTTLDYSCQLDQ